ncbi:hypothetical protein NUSPORA_01096 [Nucleospora cyclopteri]
MKNVCFVINLLIYAVFIGVILYTAKLPHSLGYCQKIFSVGNITHEITEEEMMYFLASEMCVAISLARLFNREHIEFFLTGNFVVMYINLLISVKTKKNLRLIVNPFHIAGRSSYATILFKGRCSFLESISRKIFFAAVSVIYAFLLFPSLQTIIYKNK